MLPAIFWLSILTALESAETQFPDAPIVTRFSRLAIRLPARLVEASSVTARAQMESCLNC